MSYRFQRLRSLLRMMVAVRNPFPPLLDRLGLPIRRYRATLRDGAVFELRPGRGDWPSINGAYLWNEYSPAGRPLSAGDRVIDIGANVGGFTVRAARSVGPTGRVIAVEPASDTFGQLQRNLALNNLTNTIAKQAAVGETPGTATLHVARDSVFTSLYQDVAARSTSDRIEQVAVVTLDQILEESGWDRCHFLKLDCEGAEHGIIRGMSAETASKIDQLAMEIHRLEGFEPATLLEKLKSFGFSMRERAGVFCFWRET